MNKNFEQNPLERVAQKRPTSRKTGRRFLTQRDMAMAKHDASVRLAKIKRGEATPGRVEAILVCSCGMEGCLLHVGKNNVGG